MFIFQARWKGEGWNDVPCWFPLSWICERDPVHPDLYPPTVKEEGIQVKMLPPGELVQDQAEEPVNLLEDRGEDPDKLPKEEPVYPSESQEEPVHPSESQEEPVYAPAPPPVIVPVEPIIIRQPIYPERPRPPMPPFPVPQSDEGPVYPPLEPIQPVLVYSREPEGIDVPAQPLVMQPGSYMLNSIGK